MNCPHCNHDVLSKHDDATRTVKGIRRRIQIVIKVLQCDKCKRFSRHPVGLDKEIAPKGSHYAWEVIALAIDVGDKYEQLNFSQTRQDVYRATGWNIGYATLQKWWQQYG